MRLTLLAILSFFAMANAAAQFWGKRQVLIFGEPQSRLVTEQLALLKKERSGVEERDIKISLVTKEMKEHQKYQVAPSDSFTLILVGKDGRGKFRSTQITTAQELFRIIDAMPMRQSEMRRRKKPQAKASP